MFSLYIGIFTIFMVFIWGFLLLAKIHFFKFKNYSEYIVPVTKILVLVLVFLTVLGYYLIYKMVYKAADPKTIQETTTNEVF